MKKLLLFVCSLCTVASLGATEPGSPYSPKVVVTGMHKYNPDSRDSIADRATENAIKTFDRNHVEGYQQSERPHLIITTPDTKYSLAVGGYVNMRVGYDFEGIVESPDFVTGAIPVIANYENRQKLIMDPATSRLFFKGIAKSRLLGDVVTYIETDFRGYQNNLRLRLAYLSFKGFLFGRNVTTFCDLAAAPVTVDFQGPNAYNFNFNAMVRYTHTFDKHWTLGAAAEMPQLSATYETTQDNPILQRVPDFILYGQFSWGRTQSSHIRITGVVRDMFYRNLTDNTNDKKIGWGAQFSGNIAFARHFNLLFNGVGGAGITPYIQDLTGRGLDLVPNPKHNGELQTPDMWGWFAALQYNITPRIWISGGYSTVSVETHKGYDNPTMYKKAQYIFGNCFYKLAPCCTVAVEYLYGTRKDMNGDKGHANRLQAMIQYNF